MHYDMKKTYFKPNMIVHAIHSKPQLLAGSGDRFYQEEEPDPEDAIWKMGSEIITAFFTCFSYIVQLQTKNQTLEAHKQFFVRRLVFLDSPYYISIRNLKDDIFFSQHFFFVTHGIVVYNIVVCTLNPSSSS